MKVAINAKALDGPWGGGNRFVQALTDALQRRGDAVTNQLDACDRLLLARQRDLHLGELARGQCLLGLTAVARDLGGGH